MAGRPKIKYDNKVVKKYLEQFVVLHYAPAWVDDIMAGCARLEMSGATKQLSKKTLFQILIYLDEISVDSLVDYGYSRKYAEKLALVLRISAKLVEKGLCMGLDSKEKVY